LKKVGNLLTLKKCRKFTNIMMKTTDWR